MSADGAPLLEVRELTVGFRTRRGMLVAVDRLDLSVGRGETVAIVGESGSGKSVTALAIMRLLAEPPAEILSGRVMFAGRDLLRLDAAEMRRVRGAEISMVFQEPMSSLNPLMTIGAQVMETIREHRAVPPRQAREEALGLLNDVRLPDAAARFHDYPHRLSGGQRQRVMIAIALACRPRLLIADEPTTALDVTVQAQILDLLFDLQRATGIAILLITHDLRLVSAVADRVVVMYAGAKAEEAPAAALFGAPLHPYTAGLMRAAPHGMRGADGARPRLREIPGTVPDLTEAFAGCRFAPRCPLRMPACAEAPPPLVELQGDRRAACLLAAREAAA